MRLIGEFVGNADGPTLIAVGSIHGNEPSGRAALERVRKRLRPMRSKLLGRVYLVTGNVDALSKGVRFQAYDLNRGWLRDNIIRNTAEPKLNRSEDHELHELLTVFRQVLRSAEDEVYVLDLHSTSAGGRPFATIGDTLRNRAFANSLPVTILLGIEEQLEGTMLEFLNNEGAVTLGFEAGQHDDPASVNNHEALVLLSLVIAGILRLEDLPEGPEMFRRLRDAAEGPGIFEVRHREAISETDDFCMEPGFRNFDPVRRGQILASNRDGVIRSPETGLIMMPLYQKQGEDGFFIVRRVARFWLGLSAVLRRLRLADSVRLLPGVNAVADHPEELRIDTRIARFFPLQIFHGEGTIPCSLHGGDTIPSDHLSDRE
jgi:succinylglutamate desuccinylase